MAYIYQADKWCNACGEALRAKLTKERKAPKDPSDEDTYDSDHFPKGPYPNDERTDTPDHCASQGYCLNAVELEDGSKVSSIVSDLSRDGEYWVRTRKDSPCVRLWREHYQLEPFIVALDNLEDRDGLVMVSVHGTDAARYAKDDQTIAGSRWERADDEYAYALVPDHPGLVEELEKEGYTLELSEYSPPDKEEG